MRFLHPDLAIWLLATPVVIAAWFFHVHAKRAFRRRAALDSHLAAISRPSTPLRDWVSLVAGLAAVTFVTLALMRPQWLLERRIPDYERQELVIVLDRSVSMRAQDIRPSRFERAIAEIRAFLEEKPEGIGRVGLVAFAGSALIVSRMTSDPGGLFFYLDWINEDPEPQFGTDIGAALESARELSRKDGLSDRRTIFLVLSDGDEQGEDLPGVLTALRRERMPVYTIGIGSEGSIPIPLGPTEMDSVSLALDERLFTRFNETTLREIAAVTGGRYVRSVTGNELAGAMREVVARERRLLGWKTRVEYRDLYRESLAAGAVSLLLLLLTL